MEQERKFLGEKRIQAPARVHPDTMRVLKKIGQRERLYSYRGGKRRVNLGRVIDYIVENYVPIILDE